MEGRLLLSVYWSVFISGGNTTNSQCVKNMSNLLLFVRFGGDHVTLSVLVQSIIESCLGFIYVV